MYSSINFQLIIYNYHSSLCSTINYLELSMIEYGDAGGRRASELYIGAGERASGGQAGGSRRRERHGVAFGGDKVVT